MPARVTEESILNVRQINEKYIELNIPAVMCFIDSASQNFQLHELERTKRDTERNGNPYSHCGADVIIIQIQLNYSRDE